MTNKTRKDIEAVIQDKLGFVPSFYEAIPDAALPAAWSLQDDFELGETSLDSMAKELVGLAVAAHIKCKYCIYFHTRMAQAHGATAQEIREALLVSGMTTLFSNNLTGVQTDFEAFRRDVDRVAELLG